MDNFQLTASNVISAGTTEIGSNQLREMARKTIYVVVAEVVKMASLELPDIGRCIHSPSGETLLRPAHDRILVIGSQTELDGIDQSDYWCRIEFIGPETRKVLERNWKPNLEPAYFPVGAVAQSRFGQIPMILFHRDVNEFEMMIPRSYGRSLYAEVIKSLRWVAQ